MLKPLKLLALPLCLLLATTSAQAARDDDLDDLQTKLTNHGRWLKMTSDTYKNLCQRRQTLFLSKLKRI